jgi:NitT/TauT family transport system substrate-binding protein
MSRIWSRTRLRVCLTQDLLIRMEDEARWCRKRMAPPGSMPNFYNYMYLDGLEQVRPEAVSVIH